MWSSRVPFSPQTEAKRTVNTFLPASLKEGLSRWKDLVEDGVAGNSYDTVEGDLCPH